MASLTHDDLELLMAYADGELDAEDTAEVEALLSVDADAREAVARFLSDGPLLRAAFGRDAAADEAGPGPRLGSADPFADPPRDGGIGGIGRSSSDRTSLGRTSLGRASRDPARDRRLRRRTGQGSGFTVGFPAIAASLALLVSGVAAGFLAGRSLPATDTSAMTQAVIAELAQTQRQALTAALEQLPNGQTNTWQVADGSAGGSITPTVTYVAEDGAFCREVETQANILGQPRTAVGIACREDGEWRVRYWVVEDAEPVAGLGL